MLLDADTLEAQARGCGILGAGGGGDPSIALLEALRALELHGPAEVVSLSDLPDDGLVLPLAGVGAPVVSVEKIANGSEGTRLVREAERLAGRAVTALMAAEIGGGNGLYPVAHAAALGLPIVDADGLGRAFPEMLQNSMELAGISPSPAVMTDERGNVVVLRPTDGVWLERLCRSAAVAFGGAAYACDYRMTVAEAKTATVQGSVSLAVRIGKSVQQASGDRVAALLAEIGGRRLLDGKVSDVERRVTGGFVHGSAQIEGLQWDRGRLLRIELQNENLVALEDGQVVASVPDIISVIDSQTADAISTETLRYGQRVSVVALPCAPVWRTAAGLALVGPRAFGYDFDYSPVEAADAGRA